MSDVDAKDFAAYRKFLVGPIEFDGPVATVKDTSSTTSTAPLDTDPSPRLDLSRFPHRPGAEPRPVYFDALHHEDRRLLAERGYLAQCIMELPRGTPSEEIDYLLAKAQAIEEGTVYATKLTAASLELQMKANRMLDSKNASVRVNVNLAKQDVKALLASWGSSRHTLRGNTTIQAAQLGEGPAAGAKKKRKQK